MNELISGLTAHFCTGNPSDFFGDPTEHSQQVSNGRSQICPSRVWFLTLSLSSDRPPKMEGSFLIHFPIVLAGDQDSIVTLHFACIQVSFSHAVLPRCLAKLGKRALHWSCARKAPCNFAQISSWPCSVQPFPFSSYPFSSQAFFWTVFINLCWLSQEPSFHTTVSPSWLWIIAEVLGLRAKQKEEEEDLDGTTREKVQAASVSRILIM